ncbi:hypothetical protein K2173_022638 [Erythroxylum novogranatense]|uniref:Fe2OG dioxygenase domain-containing protein n=1 Tax=Erythroxylum novogranatense TaxID=1862640 RepID=A0AAV8TQY7_9ROSI|nr:hypothetical protein K2173_022638 [Erythroxylum novogranatense]
MSQLHVSAKLPVLDLSQPAERSFLSSLALACQEWGFFYITGHGISKDLLTKIYMKSKHIFNLPIESKQKLGPTSCLKTYTPHFIASPYFECLRISGPDFFSSAKSCADELLNEDSSGFSEMLQDFGNKVMDLSKRLIEILLSCMGENYGRKFYESEFSNCHGYLRIVNYTPPKNMEENEIEGLGMHTDMSCITILYQDEIGGLQMRSKEGEWMDIWPFEEFLVVNIGDLMQAWSNGRLRSSEHRVVLKSMVNRLSLAFFWCFEDEKVVSAPDEIVGEENPRAYRPFVCLDYLKFRENSEEGRFDKIGHTVKDFAGLRLRV